MSLLNFENIPNEMISGSNDMELDWIADESGERFLTELSSDFLNYLENLENEDISKEILKNWQKWRMMLSQNQLESKWTQL